MPNLKDLPIDGITKVLLLGPSGSRKSTIAASFPKPYYMFEFDNRFRALRGYDIDFDYYPQTAGWGPVEKKLEQFKEQSRNGTLKYKTLHFASASSLLKFYLSIAIKYYKGNTQGGLRINRGPESTSLLLSDMPHFKFVHAAFNDLIDEYLLPMKCNIILEAHTATEFDKDGMPTGACKMDTTPSLREYIPSRFDETWETFVKPAKFVGKSPEYWLRFRSPLAKTSHRALPAEVEVTDREDTFYEEIFLKLARGGEA